MEWSQDFFEGVTYGRAESRAEIERLKAIGVERLKKQLTAIRTERDEAKLVAYRSCAEVERLKRMVQLLAEAGMNDNPATWNSDEPCFIDWANRTAQEGE